MNQMNQNVSGANERKSEPLYVEVEGPLRKEHITNEIKDFVQDFKTKPHATQQKTKGSGEH